MLFKILRRMNKSSKSFNIVNDFQNRFRDSKVTGQLIYRDLDSYLKEIDHRSIRSNISNIQDLHNGLIKPTIDILDRKSKYMRPMIVTMSAKILGVNDEKVINYTAALVECVHNITLIIDDIQDKSIKRRGEDCVHIKFGVDVALTSAISNAFYVIRRYLQLLNLNDPAKELEIITKYNTCIEALFVGVCWDVEWHKGIDIKNLPNWETFDYMMNLKTSRLLKLGVEILELIYNIPVQTTNPLYNILDDFGLAFQINDDIVNLASNEYAQLKSIGDDLIERKLSFLILSYLKSDKISLENKNLFISKFNIEEKRQNDIEYLIGILKSTNLIEEGTNRVRLLNKLAKKTLNEKFDENNQGVRDMCDMFDYITENIFLKNKVNDHT